MDTITAVMIIEGDGQDNTEEEILEAWQSLINTGVCWQLQGWYGRTASRLIESGKCTSAEYL